MKLKFLQIETIVKSKLNQIFLLVNLPARRNEPVMEIEGGCNVEEEQDVLTQVWQTQKKSTCWFAESLGKILQRSSSLWLQRRIIWH